VASSCFPPPTHWQWPAMLSHTYPTAWEGIQVCARTPCLNRHPWDCWLWGSSGFPASDFTEASVDIALTFAACTLQPGKPRTSNNDALVAVTDRFDLTLRTERCAGSLERVARLSATEQLAEPTCAWSAGIVAAAITTDRFARNLGNVELGISGHCSAYTGLIDRGTSQCGRGWPEF
jgi:hypothetical protein